MRMRLDLGIEDRHGLQARIRDEFDFRYRRDAEQPDRAR